MLPITLRAGGLALRTIAKPSIVSRFSTTTTVSRALRFSPKPFSPSSFSKPSPWRTTIARRTVHDGGHYQGTPLPASSPEQTAHAGRRLLTAGLIFGGTLVGLNIMFNRETRADGGMPAFEREYLNDTFMHTGLGIGIIGFSARAMVRSGLAYRIMMTNPWAVAIGGLALSFGTMLGTRSIDPDK